MIVNLISNAKAVNEILWEQVYKAMSNKTLHTGIFIGLALSVAAIYYFQAIRLQLPFIDSDTLYLPYLDKYGFLLFRPPPSNYLFPDYFIYIISRLFSSDMVNRLIISGEIQLLMAAVIAYLAGGKWLWFLFMAFFLLFGDYPLAISYHVGIFILTGGLVLFARKYHPIIIFLGGMSDPLFLVVPLLLNLFYHMDPAHDGERDFDIVIAALLGYATAFILSETTRQLLIVVPILLGLVFLTEIRIWTKFRPLNFLALSISKIGFNTAAGGSLVILASLLALIGQPGRYTIPLGLSGLLFIFSAAKNQGRTTEGINRSLAINIPLIIVMIVTYSLVLRQAIVNKDTLYCVSNALKTKGISMIGADYWLSKSLSLVSRQQIKVLPIDYSNGSNFNWITPYALLSGNVSNFIYDNAMCAQQNVDTNVGVRKYCEKDWLLAHAKRSFPICNNYTLYQTDRPISYRAPPNKLTSISDNIEKNYSRFAQRLGLNHGKSVAPD